jgi:uncharacterized membrane protein
MPTSETADVLFRADIAPHRSLSARGLVWLLAALAVAVGLIALRFLIVGAWPVALFAGIEIGLAAALFTVHHRSRRNIEVVELRREAVRIVTSARGRVHERTLASAWLRLSLTEEPGEVPRLWLRSQADNEEIAQSLGDAPKRDLARALGDAINRLRCPRFDNYQLRDG